MPFITTMTLRSGDRAALDGIVDDIDATAERKGVELKGPHTRPPDHYRVPLYRRLTGETDRQFPAWEYTVYERTLRLAGHDEAVRQLMARAFPRGVSVEVEVDQIRSIGSR